MFSRQCDSQVVSGQSENVDTNLPLPLHSISRARLLDLLAWIGSPKLELIQQQHLSNLGENQLRI